MLPAKLKAELLIEKFGPVKAVEVIVEIESVLYDDTIYDLKSEDLKRLWDYWNDVLQNIRKIYPI